MATQPSSDELLKHTVEMWIKAGRSETGASKMFGVPRGTIQNRMLNAKARWPEKFAEGGEYYREAPRHWTYPSDLHLPIIDGSVLIGGDAHIWPGPPSIMWQAFAKVGKKIKPHVIVLNGDIIDGAKVSRHGANLGVKPPSVSEEIEAAQDHIAMLPKCPHRFYTMGNHDIRVDNYLANNAPELGEEYSGLLSDRFPQWQFCWAVHLNDVEVRHRFRGGIHAAWNNALHSGVSMVTGHTHQLQITAVRNRNGSHWGIEAGMLSNKNSKAFQYTEGAPSRANEGFVVLTFREGLLMPPEFCEMVDGRPVFRGDFVF